MRFLYCFFCICFLPACMVRPVGVDNRPLVDECNFHVNNFGKGYRWGSLPVPLTFHSKTMHDQAYAGTMKVIDEWNHVWRSESGQNHDLFEPAGWVHHDDALDIREKDRTNTLTLVDRAENRKCGQSRCLLKSNQQGVTSMTGMFQLSETDIFFNEGDFEFHFDEGFDEGMDNGRHLTSLAPPDGFLRKLWMSLLKYVFFWKKTARGPASGQGAVPNHLIDFESLVAHELGHVLGLGHIEADGSIMRRQLGAGVMRRGLRRVELDSLLCGYGGEK